MVENLVQLFETMSSRWNGIKVKVKVRDNKFKESKGQRLRLIWLSKICMRTVLRQNKYHQVICAKLWITYCIDFFCIGLQKFDNLNSNETPEKIELILKHTRDMACRCGVWHLKAITQSTNMMKLKQWRIFFFSFTLIFFWKNILRFDLLLNLYKLNVTHTC